MMKIARGFCDFLRFGSKSEQITFLLVQELNIVIVYGLAQNLNTK